jgi:hypothetical protein
MLADIFSKRVIPEGIEPASNGLKEVCTNAISTGI